MAGVFNSKGYEPWKHATNGPGSGRVVHHAPTGWVHVNVLLDSGPHAGKWMRLAVKEEDVVIADTDSESREEMSARIGVVPGKTGEPV